MKLILENWRQYLTEEDEDYLVAYHCGKPNREADFDFKYLGSGEDAAILGPGLYFSTNKSLAERYCKYKENSILYRAEFPMSGIYNPTTGEPRNLRNSVVSIVKEIEKETGRDPFRGVMPLTHGKGSIGAVTKYYGPERAREVLVQSGVFGAVEKLRDSLEIALFDLSQATIKPVDTYSDEEVDSNT